jgi:titin
VGTGAASSASNSVTAPSVPSAPTIGSATSGNGTATLTWTAPSSNGGSTVTGYKVTPYLSGSAQTAQTFTSTATSQVITSLTNGSPYTFKVAAINGVGTGALSGASNSVTPATTPGAPTIGGATAGVASATVTWTAPSSTGGQPITGYVVTPYIGSTAQSAQTFSSTATSQVVTGLTAGTSYTFKVAAINSVGTGGQSSATSSVTIPTVPGTPTGVTGSTPGSGASGTINISWTAPSNGGSPITGYTVSAYLGSTLKGTATVAGTSSTNLSFSPALSTATTYTFKVAANNAVGTGGQTSGTSIRTR